ncbi:t-SNARE affecting a late Golgi compartment protein 2 [Malassezia vespertilionis]|uniref:t-SNARE affecting a late Golgi compartment protein 2 n=1 Tax=Malassezia vespertilionis TaxID=2020962 RepID=UPI0024B2028A|nr:t-SNARE affecting a late Golgi compartment protein 2 [Malassezia vespertilionis]WFD06770.1 t-SNARE affecting a late Golgi compartment protein 2 [Malassezia vespertilionis]
MLRPSTPADGPSASGYYTPTNATQSMPGVTRSRTLFFLSIRDSLTPGYASSAPLLRDDAGRKPGVFFDTDTVALSIPPPHSSLPPRWVDVSEEVDRVLVQLTPKLAELDRLHARHLLPSFVDKSEQEREIESLTADITSDFRAASRHIARLASHTTEVIRSRTLSHAELTAARNAQTALATRVQHLSSVFRRKQSLYLRRLQGMEEPEKRAVPDLLESQIAVQEDMELSQRQLKGDVQASLLLDTQDTDELNSFRERDCEITQIAKSIGELAQMFQDLNALVIEQGTMLDRIDYNIENMATDVQESSVQLRQAMAYQAGAGRRQLILLLLLSIALLVGLLVVRPFFR